MDYTKQVLTDIEEGIKKKITILSENNYESRRSIEFNKKEIEVKEALIEKNNKAIEKLREFLKTTNNLRKEY